MPLYPKNQSRVLDPELFKNPTAEYRGAPLWSWNNKLDRAQLLRQIGYFQEMGLGGFTIHPRTGLATPYLGDEFMQLVRDCAEEAKRSKLLCWLYDEDRWPSGYAGGLVTCDSAFRERQLLWTRKPYGSPDAEGWYFGWKRVERTGNGTLLGRYEITLRDGCLANYRRLRDDESPHGEAEVWYAYAEITEPMPWFNNQTYLDTLNPAAVRRFIEVTHERYKQWVGDSFGETIPAIFTDEPQFVRKPRFSYADEKKDLTFPWTDDFPKTFAAEYGEEIADKLPELFWELPEGKASVTRYRYHDHITERFAASFADQVGAWCGENGISLTGHMMEEPTLASQTHSIGEAMRSLRGFQLPGIDMLCDWRESTTAKQAQSVAHQYGREGVLSELYGVTNWDFDFIGHKAQGDWQAALGVTVRVHHLSWVSMASEAKRDYPASIFYQSPWFREYPLVEDHFARLHTVLTRGKPVIRIGVIHPIESYWLAYGPSEQTRVEREERDCDFTNLAQWLLFDLSDFNYISESLLPELCPGQTGKSFKVGAMNYDVVIVPGMRTIRATTLDRLERFADAGGKLIFAGEAPVLVDAVPSDRAQRLSERAERISLSQSRILEAVTPFREIELRHADGSRSNSILHQIREDGQRRYLFLCNTDRRDGRIGTRITIKGSWRPRLLDTFSGNCEAIPAEQRDGNTILSWDFQPHGHLLLELDPGELPSSVPAVKQTVWREISRVNDPVPVTLSEPNVLLLDQAEWRLDDGVWQQKEETLRIANLARNHWGLGGLHGSIAQPWTDTEPVKRLGHVTLRFSIESTVAVAAPSLALENAEGTEIFFDGVPVASAVAGWWIDEAIQTVGLPSITPGRHQLILRMPFDRKTSLEWCFLLGDFGVEVAGRHARLVEPVRELAFGDWTRQGLPFYGGNVTYHTRLNVVEEGRPLAAMSPHFKAPLLKVSIDGKEAGPIAFAPFQVEFGKLAAGKHQVDFTAFGNRINCCGPIHNVTGATEWVCGPQAWRTNDREYSYEYQLKPMGILSAPMIMQPS